LKKLHC
jgi:hypothetical protein